MTNDQHPAAAVEDGDPFGPFPARDVDLQAFRDAARLIGITVDSYVLDRRAALAAMPEAIMIGAVVGVALACALGAGVVQLTEPATWPEWFPTDWREVLPPAVRERLTAPGPTAG